jgi:glutathione S-transferase
MNEHSAARLAMNDLPVFYTFRRCPYAMRARLALAVSGLEIEQREIALRDKPQALRDASSKATVPVLVLPHGEVIDESLAIMLWALKRYDPAKWLQPDRGSLEEMLTLIGKCDQNFKFALERYKYPNRYADEMGGCETQITFAQRHREAGGRLPAELERLLVSCPADT